MTQTILLYLLAINAFALIVSIIDKGFAVYDKRRIPEGLLLALAFSGGAVGAKLAQIVSGHKRLKIEFSASLSLIAFLQLGLAAAIWAHQERAQVTELYERLALHTEDADPEAEAKAKGVTHVSDGTVLPRRFGPGSD